MSIDAPAAAIALEVDASAPAAAPAPLEVDAAAGTPESVPLLEKFLVRKLQRGDARAFRDLVRKHQDRVFSMSLRMLGNAQEAEDVSQEVFVAVHRHLPRFRGDCRLSTWIFRVTKNHCLNRIKYLERRETDGETDLERVDAGDAADGFITAPERPDKALLGAEERRHVQQALNRLSAEHRLLVVLRDIEGMSYEECARIADLPPGTVRSRLHRARAALAEILAGEGMTPDGLGGNRGGES
jgi:RNA polymerase sigma-70 factor (ECF subfamily)